MQPPPVSNTVTPSQCRNRRCFCSAPPKFAAGESTGREFSVESGVRGNIRPRGAPAIRHEHLSNRHFRESSGAIILRFDDELSSRRLSGDPLRSCSLAAVGGVNTRLASCGSGEAKTLVKHELSVYLLRWC